MIVLHLHFLHQYQPQGSGTQEQHTCNTIQISYVATDGLYNSALGLDKMCTLKKKTCIKTSSCKYCFGLEFKKIKIKLTS